MIIKDYKVNFSCKLKQRPVITLKLKEIILETNQAFMTEISENFEGTFFHLIFVGLPFFCFFKILKALHKFELISAPMVIVLRKQIIFESLVFKY